MIRALGGSAATLLFPSAVNKEVTPGLGLGSPTTQELEVSPVAIITLPVDSELMAARLEILIPASAIFVTMAERLAATPQNLFDSALGIIHEGRLLRIETWNAEYFAGSPYIFRVTVQG
jgi:hypothetical protein